MLQRHQMNQVPVDVESIARGEGIKIVCQSLGDIAGMLVRDGGEVVICTNSKHPPVRQRFTIAHELGHYSLHRGRELFLDAPAKVVKVDFRENQPDGPTHREEIEANAFAAELLMPEGEVTNSYLDIVEEDPEIEEAELIVALAESFGVSKQAMTYRMINLGLSAPK